MSATNQFEIDLLTLIFNNVAAPNIGDVAGLLPSAVAGNLYVSLHTAPLTDTSTDQTESEATYTGYARIAVPRTAGGWTVGAGVVTNTAEILFPPATSGPETVTYFGIGFELTGAGYLQLWSPLDSSLLITTGVTPRFPIGSLSILLD